MPKQYSAEDIKRINRENRGKLLGSIRSHAAAALHQPFNTDNVQQAHERCDHPANAILELVAVIIDLPS
jgi:hypothetical protein